ncbi:MAG: hypothetical protein E7393_03715 [Ruminococcaceae bacterium]|nr:hypothetical protein [Oscillospiraceae bacterium]
MSSRAPDLKYNDSGYVDNTSFEALKKIRREERRQLIYEIKELAKKYGYEVINTIELKEIESDGYD